MSESTWKILSVFFEAIFALTAVYFLVTLTLYYIRKQRAPSSGDSTKRRHRIRRLFCSMLGIFLLVIVSKSSLSFAFVIMSNDNNLSIWNCAQIGIAHQFTHSLGYSIIFLYFWIRLFLLYQNKFMSRVVPKCMIRLNNSLLVIIVLLSFVSLVVCFFAIDPDEFEIRDEICFYKPKNGTVPNDYVIYIFFSLIILIHGSLVFLFIFILRRHQQRFTSASNVSSRSQWVALKRLRYLMKHCLLASSISTVAALGAVIIDAVLRGQFSLLTSNLMWDFELYINLFCLLICFPDWKQIALPWKHDVSIDLRRPSMMSSISVYS